MSLKQPQSKEEYLKKYLSKSKAKKTAGSDMVHYISGEMPDNLDAFDEKTKLELNMFKEDSATTAMETQVRKRKALSEDIINSQTEKARKRAELEAKYALWNRGIDTTKEIEAELQSARNEAAKPFARYADDVDLNIQQQDRIRAEDPMAAYFEEKQAKRKKKDKKRKHGDGEAEERPRYRGPPEPPANRYGIWPGYRWDGVDRSNGFETKIVDDMTRRKLENEMAYKWGCEDM